MATLGYAPLAVPALFLGAAALAVGPVFVWMADVAPIASAFYRMALASPVLVVLALMTGIGAVMMLGSLAAARCSVRAPTRRQS